MPMRILITGASGFIGSNLVRHLSTQGHEVVACVRNISRYTRYSDAVTYVECDFNHHVDSSDWLPLLDDIDMVINAVGIIQETASQKFSILHTDAPIALFKACAELQIKKVIQVSALGADESALSQYHLSKKKADNSLISSDLKWIIVLPSIVYGPGAKSMSFFKALASLVVTPLVEQGEQKIQPIHINDFCKAVAQLLVIDGNNRKINFVGPEAVTLKQTFVLLKCWLGVKKARFLPLSYNGSMLLARVGKWLPGIKAVNPLSTETIQMLKQGSTASVDPFVKLFSFTPISFSDSLARSPAQQADKWHAKLLLLRPLLIFSIAFIWIYTGIVSAFLYPIEGSQLLLAPFGVEGKWSLLAIYGFAFIDLVLGVAIL
ncbi:hypothetical protein MNBD_GAMMA12-3782, partial [hydrothermal vent metagenome]